jgi:hypothetical protein
MRMMLKFKKPTEAGNQAVRDGSLPKRFEPITGQFSWEAMSA